MTSSSITIAILHVIANSWHKLTFVFLPAILHKVMNFFPSLSSNLKLVMTPFLSQLYNLPIQSPLP